MRPRGRLDRFFHGRSAAGVVLLLLIAVASWGTFRGGEAFVVPGVSGNDAEGAYLGKRPAPVEPSIIDPAMNLLMPRREYRLMTIHHIPPIERGGPMPHPFVGDCKNCHLFRGGPPPGSQPKTPIGAVLEELSKVKKLGPPLRPISSRPHPPAGRCIKCHDIVVKVPIKKKKNGFIWKP